MPKRWQLEQLLWMTDSLNRNHVLFPFIIFIIGAGGIVTGEAAGRDMIISSTYCYSIAWLSAVQSYATVTTLEKTPTLSKTE